MAPHATPLSHRTQFVVCRVLRPFNMRVLSVVFAFWLFAAAASRGAETDSNAATKRSSTLFPSHLTARALHNVTEFPWAQQARDRIVAEAQPWVTRTDDELWDLMFGNTIKRSWMVWSNGHCPACEAPVPMYEWIPDAMARPWTMQCPRCRELFPKNDFARFYRSGLNEHGVFEPARADRSLLFNAEHPDPHDPLHHFGVDDGNGYVEGEQRWRFIGAYLIYGQWKQAIVTGIRSLAAAYVVTGDPIYAHKAGVMLDRVADLYPTFDFGKEGVMYEGPPSAGYVSTWHDACVEVYELTLAYDMVFEAIAQDATLVSFLAAKAQQYRLPNAKSSFREIQRNIEDGILRDTLANRPKIESNYPSTDITIAAIQTVLGWPDNRAEVTTILDRVMERSTAVDGLSGEKGIAGYSTIAPRTIADLLGRYERMEPGFIEAALQRQPRLRELYRFHLDTWCLGEYYPCIGDSGAFAQKVPYYPAVTFSRFPDVGPSGFTFLDRLAAATGDNDFIRLLYAANDNQVAGLPYDLFAEDPAELQRRVKQVITDEGAAIQPGSVNKTQWCLAILRSGQGADARAVWLDYDSGGGHGHADAMNLGLFAKGLDLMPDFGYPPVQYGGWGAPRAVWYTQTAAHNTVVVDDQNTRSGSGIATAWIDGDTLRAVRASAPDTIGGQQYERTVMMIDVSPSDSYVIDLFRVVGGQQHAKLIHGHFGHLVPSGLSLQATEETLGGQQMRSWRKDSQPKLPWSVDWKIEDHLNYLPAGKQLNMRYTDLTPDTEVLTAEAWVAVGLYGGTAEAWIPRVVVRRRAPAAPLASTFVGVFEPYEQQPLITHLRRLDLVTDDGQPAADSDIALELQLSDGRRDVVVALDPQLPLGPARRAELAVRQNEHQMRLVGQFGFARFDAAGTLQRLLLGNGTALRVGRMGVDTHEPTDWVEVDLTNAEHTVISSSPAPAKYMLRTHD